MSTTAPPQYPGVLLWWLIVQVYASQQPALLGLLRLLVNPVPRRAAAWLSPGAV
jgi:hypothetical protein